MCPPIGSSHSHLTFVNGYLCNWSMGNSVTRNVFGKKIKIFQTSVCLKYWKRKEYCKLDKLFANLVIIKKYLNDFFPKGGNFVRSGHTDGQSKMLHSKHVFWATIITHICMYICRYEWSR
jgi:hypothetical protein